MTRYATTTGHHVMRRFGWDCHGLPVEYEIDKKLGECQGLQDEVAWAAISCAMTAGVPAEYEGYNQLDERRPRLGCTALTCRGVV